MTKQYPSKQYLSEVISSREFAESVPPEIVIVMARQLLAGLEQEPVAYIAKYESGAIHGTCDRDDPVKMEWLKRGMVVSPLYAAPRLPQPAVVPDFVGKLIGILDRHTIELGWGEKPITIAELVTSRDGEEELSACRAAMLQGAGPVPSTDNIAQQFESLGCAEDTSRRFKCTGLIVTSDERKMEIPHCSKHPETELQVHPFEQLMSYPPRPVMYCPLCRPSVAEWVALDKQLRRQRNGK